MARFGTKKGGVSSRDQMIASRVASGDTYATVATHLKISERTVKRAMSRPEVRSEVDSVRALAIECGLGILCDNFTAAARELARLVREGVAADSVRLGAVRLAIDAVLRVRENVTLAREVSELRKLYEQSENGTEPIDEAGEEPPDEPGDVGDAEEDPGRSDDEVGDSP